MLLYLRAGFNFYHIRALWKAIDMDKELSVLVWEVFSLLRSTCFDLVMNLEQQMEN